MTHDYPLDTKCLPRHVAIIMDGNGRWAKREGVSRAQGHEAGAQSVRAVIEMTRELGVIEALTLYAFSTENWRRSKSEVNALFRLLSKYIRLELDNLHAQNIRVQILGRTDALPKKAQADLRQATERTRDNTAMTLNLAVNYGARTELADAARAIAEKVKDGTLDCAKIDEACVGRHLYAPEFEEVDLLIRTSGEMRVSNFLLWQISYAEIVVTGTLWPDFQKSAYLAALQEYEARSRRFGGR